MKEWD
jgi:hypothetical protein